MPLNNIEEEVVLLKSIKELIDSMVNFEILSLLGNDPDSRISFESITHQRFFNIVLVDFLSRTDPNGPIRQTSYLGALRTITGNPSFNVGNSVEPLRDATQRFVDWLEEIIEVDVWLPSIDTQVTLQITRIRFLKMCGNISKHNVLRAVSVAKELYELLVERGIKITIEDTIPALSNFYDRFHTDILTYHASTIAEFLNNIRWGIYDYLQPEFQRSIVWKSREPPIYEYTYPDGVTANLAKEYYWELMNEVRMPPYVRRFEVTKLLKLRY